MIFTQHQALKDGHPLVEWRKRIKGYLGRMLDVEEKYLLKASAISTPEEICGPPYVTLAGIEFDLVLWRKS